MNTEQHKSPVRRQVQRIRHFAALHSGFCFGKRTKAGMKRSEILRLHHVLLLQAVVVNVIIRQLFELLIL